MNYQLVDLDESNVSQAVQIWENGWHEAHGRIVPAELIKLRTSASFTKRLRDYMANARVALKASDVLGFYITREDELYQMYVSPKARGKGLAQALMADAENRLLRAGHKLAWLSCAVGNERAAKFYEKSSWENAGVQTVEFDTSQGDFPLQVWRFEKGLI